MQVHIRTHMFIQMFMHICVYMHIYIYRHTIECDIYTHALPATTPSILTYTAFLSMRPKKWMIRGERTARYAIIWVLATHTHYSPGSDCDPLEYSEEMHLCGCACGCACVCVGVVMENVA